MLSNSYKTIPKPSIHVYPPCWASAKSRSKFIVSKLYASHIHKLKTYLTSRPLSSYRQMHGMSSPPIGSHIPQSTNVIFDLPPQLVLYLHVRQVCRKCCYRLVVHISDSSAWEDVMFGEDPWRVLLANAIECLKGFLQGGKYGAFMRIVVEDWWDSLLWGCCRRNCFRVRRPMSAMRLILIARTWSPQTYHLDCLCLSASGVWESAPG